MKVLRFSVGFGTPLVRWHDRHGTEFVVAAIPLGGYVKMLDEREAEVPAHLLEQSFNRKTVRQRIAIVAAGPIANFLLAILFFWVVALLGSQQVRPVIGSVAPESLAAQAGLEAGQELLAVDGEPVTGWSGSTCSWFAVSARAVRWKCGCRKKARMSIPPTRCVWMAG